jgi:hypothetical protein
MHEPPVMGVRAEKVEAFAILESMWSDWITGNYSGYHLRSDLDTGNPDDHCGHSLRPMTLSRLLFAMERFGGTVAASHAGLFPERGAAIRIVERRINRPLHLPLSLVIFTKVTLLSCLW